MPWDKLALYSSVDAVPVEFNIMILLTYRSCCYSYDQQWRPVNSCQVTYNIHTDHTQLSLCVLLYASDEDQRMGYKLLVYIRWAYGHLWPVLWNGCCTHIQYCNFEETSLHLWVNYWADILLHCMWENFGVGRNWRVECHSPTFTLQLFHIIISCSYTSVHCQYFTPP